MTKWEYLNVRNKNIGRYMYNEIYISINMYTIILQQWNNSMIEKYKMYMWDIFGG